MSVLDIFKKKEKKQISDKKKEKEVIPSSTEKTVVSSVSSKEVLQKQGFLLKPYFSEKFTFLREKQNKYIFEVHPKATKNEIKKLLEDIYNVKILRINVLSASQKTKRWRNKKGVLKGNKKMIITLKKGQNIDLGI
jgi:large subunit ribosomal protein L23